MLKRAAIGAGVIALFAALAVSVPSRGTELEQRGGFSFELLAQNPSVEYVGPDARGGYRMPEEMKQEIAFESDPRHLQLVLADPRIASPHQRVRASVQVQKMLRAQPVSTRRKASAQRAGGGIRAQLPQKVGAAPGGWRSLGPDNLGGRTHALAVDPTDTNVVYAGGIGGGVWKSTDRGESWRPLNDTLSNIAISSIAIDPTNTQIVYAATGDALDQYERIGSRGAGLLKTTDGGKTWEFLPGTGGPEFAFTNIIKLSPNDPNRIYAATSKGVLVSSDGGQTWNHTYVSALQQDPLGCTDMTIRTDQNPDHVIVACGGFYEADGIYRSQDSGQSWEKVLSDVQGALPGRTAVAYAPGSQDIVYASVSYFTTDFSDQRFASALALLRSDSNGDPGTWTVMNNGDNSVGTSPNWLAWCGSFGGQGFYDNVIAVDPTNADRVWVGGVDLYRSEDGGRTLYPMSYWFLDYYAGFSGAYDGIAWVHADQHVLLTDPNYDGQSNTSLWIGNDGGVFRTDNATAPLQDDYCDYWNPELNKVVFQTLNTGYVTSLFREGSISDDGRVYAGGLQDNGTWAERDVTKPVNPWDTISGGDGGFTTLDSIGGTALVTYPLGSMELIDIATKTATNATAGITERGLFVPPIARDPNDQARIWFGADSMWKTDNGAHGWRLAGFDFPGGKIGYIAVAKADSNVVYAGTKDGQIWKTTDGLAEPPTWAQVGAESFPGPPRNSYTSVVTGIEVDPNDVNTVYVTFGVTGRGKVFKTTDGGATWTAIDGVAPEGIPEQTGAQSVTVNPLNSSMVYVGTDNGVFESLDGGATWRVANENLATTTVEDLIFAPGTSELYAFTYGRGVYRVDVGNAAPPINDNIEAATGVNLNPDFRDKVNVRLATSEGADPPVGCAVDGGQQRQSVWYRFSPSDGGNYQISTEDSNYDTVLAVFTGSAGSLSPAACDDDALGAGGASQVTLNASPGTTYFIEVTKSSDAVEGGLSGTLVLRVARQ